MDSFAFNTAVAAMMEFVNFLSANRDRAGAAGPELWRKAVRELLILLSPITPFITEELWHRCGFQGDSVCTQDWPVWSDEDLVRDTIEIVVQVKGKIRGRLDLPSNTDGKTMEKKALELPRIQEILGGKEPRRVITVPGKLVNIIP